MNFKKASAPFSAQHEDLLSADNSKPDRFALIDTVRRAASFLQLGPQVIATLDALLSCLPPKRTHDVVFASNATLVMRRNGISERTLRRHLADLITAGMLNRIDSPNGKRYSKRDSSMGTVLRFGLDLAPLFGIFSKLDAIAKKQALILEKNAYLRTKLRVAIQLSITNCCDSEAIIFAKKALRRKLTNEELTGLLEKLQFTSQIIEDVDQTQATSNNKMSASNGQNVRHQQNSEKELNDKKLQNSVTDSDQLTSKLTLEALTEACPQATEFLPEKISTYLDVIAHARRLAPMIGVDHSCYEGAEKKHGSLGAALTIWGLLEIQDKIHKPGAYFRAITTGVRSSTFSPWQFINRLMKIADRKNCPRTTPVQHNITFT